MDNIKRIKKTVLVPQEKEYIVCPECGLYKETIEEVELCAKADRIIKEKKRKLEVLEMRKAEAISNRLIDEMPKLDAKVYAKLAIELALVVCPPMIPCLGCGHPRITGCICENSECPGEPDEADDIDEEDLFYDDNFTLPNEWHIVFD